MATIREILEAKGHTLVKDMQKPSGPVWKTSCAQDRKAGEDRFLVYDGQGSNLAPRLGTYYCRHQCDDCAYKGDAITFVRTFCGCGTLGAALRYLGLPDSEEWKAGVRVRTAPRPSSASSASSDEGAPEPKSAWAPKATAFPPATWSDWAEELLTDSLQVWHRIQRQGGPRTDDERTAMAALEWRGLTVETALALEIGWIPERCRVERKDAGLDVHPDLSYMIIPSGLLLSVRRTLDTGADYASRIVSLTVRCIPPYESRGKTVKLKHIAGSRSASFFRGRIGAPAFLMESILDAALLWQSSRGQCGVVAAIAADLNPDVDADRFLRLAGRIVIVPDADGTDGQMGPGERAAMRWTERYASADVVPAVGGKDLGAADLAARKGDLGAMPIGIWLAWMWIEYGLPGACPAVLPSGGAEAPATKPSAPAPASTAQEPAGGGEPMSVAEALQAVQKDGMNLAGLPMPLRTEAVCEAAVLKNPQALRFVPEGLRTHDLVTLALERDGTLLATEISVDGESGTDVPPEKRRTGGTRCLVPRRKASYLATALQHGLDVPAFLRAQSEDDDRIPAGRAYAVGVRCGAVAMEDVPEPLQDAIRRLAPSSDPAR